MKGLENYNEVPSNTLETPATTVPSDVNERSLEKSPEVSKRDFLRAMLKIGGAAAVAGLGTLVSQDVEARQRRRWVPEIDEARREEVLGAKYEQSEAHIEYRGFRPDKYDAMVIRARLKQIVPDAKGAKLTLERPKGSSLVTMSISVLRSDNTEISANARFNVSSHDVGRDADFTPALSHLFVRLQTEIQKK